jgi:hypothetical protein
MTARICDVRFTPENGLWAVALFLIGLQMPKMLEYSHYRISWPRDTHDP